MPHRSVRSCTGIISSAPGEFRELVLNASRVHTQKVLLLIELYLDEGRRFHSARKRVKEQRDWNKRDWTRRLETKTAAD